MLFSSVCSIVVYRDKHDNVYKVDSAFNVDLLFTLYGKENFEMISRFCILCDSSLICNAAY